MALITSIAIYVGLGFFLVGCLLRILQYARTPVHFRAEIYPVPGEGERAKYGGSYLEQGEWWKHPREKSRSNEVKVIFKDIFLQQGVWKVNRPLWWRTFPFHTGLYLLIVSCLFSALGVVSAKYQIAGAVFGLARICAWAGLSLTLIGSISLAWRRVTDKDMRLYTVPGDLMNLGGFALACMLILAGGFSATMPPLKDAVYGLLTLRPELHLPVLVNLGLIVGSAMVGYTPYTHMAHFIAKYFIFFDVRWDNAVRTKAIEAGIAKNLKYHPTWSASHVGADGEKSWAEIVTSSPVSAERMPK